MADTEKSRRGEPNPGKLYTLSEVSKKTGISMPTLQRYKKSYQSRIPSTGSGRSSAIPKERWHLRGDQERNPGAGTPAQGRRGPGFEAPQGRVPRPAASPRGRGRFRAGRKTAASTGRGASPGAVSDLTQVGKMTGIRIPRWSGNEAARQAAA
jgi:hypothetical protein